VRDGVLYAGRLEASLGRYAAWLRCLGFMRWPTAAFAAPSVAAQRALLVESGAEVVRGERLWRALFHPAGVALALRDPSFRRSTEGRVGTYLYGRMLEFASRRLLRESALLNLIWFGRYDPFGALPLWLDAEVAERARKHLTRLELVHASVETIARRPPRGATLGWSLSDVSAWMSEERFHALLATIAHSSPPASRLCWRHLAAHWATPVSQGLVIEAELARRLERDDASVFYAIGVARVAAR
jgi:S-adenosylmethionine:diacylglycerol 3-amino-3-carboxypropyl transferase